jgi:hypothetical protein
MAKFAERGRAALARQFKLPSRDDIMLSVRLLIVAALVAILWLGLPWVLVVVVLFVYELALLIFRRLGGWVLLLIGVAAFAFWGCGLTDRTPLDPHPDQPLLVAMGDSYMSGEGAPRFFPGTNNQAAKDRNECRRTSSAWPYLFAQDRGWGLEFLACSGAATKDIALVGQYPQSPEGLYGGVPQIEVLKKLVAGERPIAAIVVSIGGNDARFGEVVQSCLAPGDCQDRSGSWWLRNLRPVKNRLIATYGLIREVAATENIPVVAVDYPIAADVPAPGHRCDDGTSLSQRELQWLMETFMPAINAAVREAADAAGIQFIDLANAFGTHRLCSPTSSSSNTDINFIGATPIEGGLFGRFYVHRWFHNSFHPNPRGHRAMVQTVRQQLDLSRWPLEPKEARPLSVLLEPLFYPPMGAYPAPADSACAAFDDASFTASEPVFDGELSMRFGDAKPGSTVCYETTDGWSNALATQDGMVEVPLAPPGGNPQQPIWYQRSVEGHVLTALVTVVFCDQVAKPEPACGEQSGGLLRNLVFPVLGSAILSPSILLLLSLLVFAGGLILSPRFQRRVRRISKGGLRWVTGVTHRPG